MTRASKQHKNTKTVYVLFKWLGGWSSSVASRNFGGQICWL